MSVPDRIERSVRVRAPIERVWRALTEAEQLAAWFADRQTEIDLRPGGTASFRWMGEVTTPARVKVVERPHRFAFRWAACDAPGAPWTLVTFTLAELDAQHTLVHVEESGFAALPEMQGRRARHDNTAGWRQELDELVAHVELPLVTP